jgi:hypothetical protein
MKRMSLYPIAISLFVGAALGSTVGRLLPQRANAALLGSNWSIACLARDPYCAAIGSDGTVYLVSLAIKDVAGGTNLYQIGSISNARPIADLVREFKSAR